MRAKQLVFIDDSGDAGVKACSSSHFVIAAVVFDDYLVAEEVALAMRKFRRQINWTDDHEYKFNKTKKNYIKRVLRLVSRYDFSIYAVVINKARINSAPKNLYNDSIVALLRAMPLHNTSIKIDGHAGTNYTKRVISRVRNDANAVAGQIADIKFVDSKENVLIQLADLVASSIFRSTQKSKADHQDYLAILKKRIIQIWWV